MTKANRIRPYRNLNAYWDRQFDRTDWTREELVKVHRKATNGLT